MGRFKAGDRVKILAGHPYWLGEHRNSVGEEGEGVYIGRAGKRHRGKHLVEVTYDGGRAAELSFKGRELEPLAEAEAWVPKVGDRVRKVRGEGDERPAGSIGVVAEAVGDMWRVKFDAPFAGWGEGNNWHCDATDLEPLPVAEQPAGLVVEAGKFYRTRDGRKVGPMRARDYAPESPFCFVGETADGYRLIFKPDGENYDGPTSQHTVIAEWVEPAYTPAATPEPATAEAKFKVGDRVVFVEDYSGVVKAGDVGVIVGFWAADGRCDGGVQVEHTSGIRTCFARRVKPAPTSVGAAPTNFIVARLTPNGAPRPNARPRVHTTLADAEAEAQRLADRLGDEFAVYQRVSSKTVDAGPVPSKDGWAFEPGLARKWLAGEVIGVGSAFPWDVTKQGFTFWATQAVSGLTPLGRAILRKWIAEVEAGQDSATTGEVAA